MSRFFIVNERTEAMIELKAPAKINLFLAVGGLLPNKLHEIESVIISVDLYDNVVMTGDDSLSFECDDPEISGEGNLAFRTAAMVRKKYGIERGVKIRLEKRIPVAAGLGGGSSDAAAVLKGLNSFWGLGLSTEKLTEFAAELGADVFYFLKDGCRFVRGYGQIVSEVGRGDIDSLYFVLGKPGASLATELVYRRFDEVPVRENRGPTGMLEALAAGGANRLVKEMRNDLESAAISLCPSIREIKEAAKESGARRAMVSGSGPTVVAVCESEPEAIRVEAAMAAVAPFTRICRAVR